MKNIIVYIMLVIISCSNNNAPVLKNANTQFTDNIEFRKFIANFNPKQLPLDIIPKNDKEFNFDRAISLSEAKHFLCERLNSDCLKQPNGGYYNYYYSNKIEEKGFNLYFLTYYRVSDRGTDYILSIFDSNGKLVSSLIVGGQIDDVSQKESYISANFQIRVSNWTIINKELDNVFITEKETKTYSIDKTGNINLVNSINLGQKRCEMIKEQNFRIVEITK